MALQSNSNAGKVRAALDELGWNADANEVAKKIGPVKHSIGGCYWDSDSGRWAHETYIEPLPAGYINAVRRKFRHLAKGPDVDPAVYEWI